jgi:hypothetical protein
MADIDIFISYKTERRKAAEHLAAVLELYGYSVWFDDELVKGRDFGTQIDRKIREARALVVLWCPLSIESRWVVEEAHLADERGILIPVVIESCRPPVGFSRQGYIDLSSWEGSPRSHQLDPLIKALEERVGRSAHFELQRAREYEATWRRFGAPSFKALALGQAAASVEGGRRLPQTDAGPAASRRTKVRLQASRPYAPRAYDQHLASVELQASQPGPGEPLPVSAELVCWEAPVEGVVIAVKRGRLSFDCGEARADLKSHASEADHSRETRKIILRRSGSSQQPVWEVIADGPIGVLSLPHDFCLVHDLAAGDVLTASFRVYIKDLDLVEPPETDGDEEARPQDESFSFMRPDFRKLGRAKQRILKRLAEMKLPEGPDGWVELCSDKLKFQEIDAGGDNDE